MKLYSDSIRYHCTLHQFHRHLPYLLMLHGFMGSGAVFDHLIRKLLPFCNLVTIDLAGHGKTKSPASPKFYTAKRQISQLKSIIQRLKFENLYLYGYSMGGRLAFQLLASCPELFAGVVIESSHCGMEPGTERTERQEADKQRAREIEEDFNKFVDQWLRMPLFEHTPAGLQSVYEKILRQQKPENMSASLRGFGSGVMPFVCDQIAHISLPVTLIAGELDQKYSEVMKSIEQKCELADLHIIKGAGHRVHTAQPGKLVSVLKNALTQN